MNFLSYLLLQYLNVMRAILMRSISHLIVLLTQYSVFPLQSSLSIRPSISTIKNY